MTKLCRLIENELKEQLLLMVKPSEEDGKADAVMMFEVEGATVTVTIGSHDYDKAEKWMNVFPKETIDSIFHDPMAYLQGLMGMDVEDVT